MLFYDSNNSSKHQTYLFWIDKEKKEKKKKPQLLQLKAYNQMQGEINFYSNKNHCVSKAVMCRSVLKSPFKITGPILLRHKTNIKSGYK